MTLAIDYDSLRREVGRVLGFGNEPSGFRSEQAQLVHDRIADGLRKFYYPQATASFHEWTFLKPEFEWKTVANQEDYDLPEDFGGTSGDLHFDPSDNTHECIKIVGEAAILALRQSNTSETSYPMRAAIRPKNTTGESPQRWELMLWPTPDDEYTLRGSYRADPPMLSEDRKHPHGGAQHANTILYACLSSAAAWAQSPEAGMYDGLFKESLSASIKQDQSGTRPEHFGYVGNGGMRWHSGGRMRRFEDQNDITYNGQLYSGP